MKRFFAILIIVILAIGATIFTLASDNRDHANEYRMTDHDGDDPFEYEWVDQDIYDVDGPGLDNSGSYDIYDEAILWSSSSSGASQYYEEPHSVSCSTTVGYNPSGFALGPYRMSAYLYHGVQKGLTLVSTEHQRTSDPGPSNATFTQAFSDTAYAYGSFEEEFDPLASLEFCVTSGTISTNFKGVFYGASSRASVPSAATDITTW